MPQRFRSNIGEQKVIWLLLSLAFAEDVVTVKEGEPAPFEGTLMKPSAIAKLLADHDAKLEACKVNSKKDLALQEAKSTLKLKLTEADLAACNARLTTQEKMYNDLLNQTLEKRSLGKTAIFAGGVVTGIGVMLGSAWILNQIGDTNAK